MKRFVTLIALPLIITPVVACSTTQLADPYDFATPPSQIEPALWKRWNTQMPTIQKAWQEALARPDDQLNYNWKNDDQERWNLQSLLDLDRGHIQNLPDLAKLDLSKLNDLLTLWFNLDLINWNQGWQGVDPFDAQKQSRAYHKAFRQINDLQLTGLTLSADPSFQPFIINAQITFNLTWANSSGFTLTNRLNQQGERQILSSIQVDSWAKMQITSEVVLAERQDQGTQSLDLLGLNFVGDTQLQDLGFNLQLIDPQNYLIPNVSDFNTYLQFLNQQIDQRLKQIKQAWKRPLHLQNQDLSAQQSDYQLWAKTSAINALDNAFLSKTLSQKQPDFWNEWKIAPLAEQLFLHLPAGAWQPELTKPQWVLPNFWAFNIPLVIPKPEGANDLRFVVRDHL